MGAFGGLILTNKGRALQAKAQAGAQLQYTKIKIGDGNLGGQSIPTLTDLISPKKTLGIRKIEVRPGGIAVVSTVLSNADITEGFYFREIGVFAQDPDVGEILYCYANAGANAEYIPPGGGPDIIEKHIDIRTLTGNAQNVSAVIDQSLIWATKQELDDALNEAKEYTDIQISSITPASIGAETPAGAQIKADTAETNAKNFASGIIGSLASLLTTAKNTVVAAINELKTAHDAHLKDFAQVWNNRIVEMGSNANGTYVRWSNGLQICYNFFDLTGISTSTKTGVQGLTIYYHTIVWTFPASFINNPIVSVNGRPNPGYEALELINIRSTSNTTSVTFTVEALASFTNAWVYCMAIGRWK